MRQISFWGVLSLCLCMLAVFTTQAKADAQTIRSSDNAIWIAGGGGFLNYKESIPSPYLSDSQRGMMPSVATGFSILGNENQGPVSNLYFALEGSGTFGQDTYRGSYLATPTTPLQLGTSEHIWTFDAKVGKAFPVGPSALLTPYIEGGYRYWARNLSSMQTEDYKNGDVLAGLMAQISPIDRLTLTGYGSLGTTVSPSMTAHNGFTGTSTDYDLGSAGMYKIGGKVGFDVTQQIELFTTLDYDKFRFAQSQTANDGSYEPGSKTEETTWRVGVGYHFN